MLGWAASALYLTGYAFVYCGWIAHRSESPWFLGYSRSYAFILLLLAVPFGLPLALRYALRKFGRRTLLFSLTPVALVLLLGYFAAGFYYYHTQVYRFDPYLQLPPPRLRGAVRTRQPAAFGILTLGGSTTRCGNLPADKRYPAVLAALLQARYPSVRIELFNGGNDWYTTKHSLINYATQYRDWKPDLVIHMEAINDLYRSFSPPKYAMGGYDQLWTHFYGPAARAARSPSFEAAILDRVPLSKTWYAALRQREVDYPVERYVSRGPAERYLRTLVRYARADGAEVLLVSQPTLLKEAMTPKERAVLWFAQSFCVTQLGLWRSEIPSPGSMSRAMVAFNETTRRVAAAEGARFVDAESAFSKDPSHFVDDVHYTELGAKVLAAAVADGITDWGVIDRAARVPERP